MLAHSELAALAERVYVAPWTDTVDGDVRDLQVSRGGETVVVFPGTHPASALDWLRDIWLAPVHVAGIGRVHSGFGLGARDAFARILPVLAEDRPISFTGHSLGGALALACAGLFAYARPGRPYRVITFGAPRLSWFYPALRRRLASAAEAIEYQRHGDIVPNLLPSPLYWRGGRRVRIGESFGDFIEDHAMARYVEDVAKLERR